MSPFICYISSRPQYPQPLAYVLLWYQKWAVSTGDFTSVQRPASAPFDAMCGRVDAIRAATSRRADNGDCVNLKGLRFEIFCRRCRGSSRRLRYGQQRRRRRCACAPAALWTGRRRARPVDRVSVLASVRLSTAR